METNQFNVTPQAAEEIIRILKEEEPEYRFRISVLGGGCSGFQYNFTIDRDQTADDHIFDMNDAPVIIDQISLDLLKNSELDFESSMVGSQFVIKNPNATKTCGCGNSFSI